VSLGNLGNRLADMGRYGKALEAGQQAEEIWRELAEKQPDAYRANWAVLLGNLGLRLAGMGRYEEALKAAQQSEEIWRERAEKQPDAYREEWATSLANLGDAQVASGMHVAALASANEAIAGIAPFADHYPLKYGPWLGFGRRVLAEAHLGLGELDVAFVEARRSVEIWTELARLRPNFEAIQVAKAFRTLVKSEIALGQTESVVESLGRVYELLKNPWKKNPEPLRVVLLEIVSLVTALDSEAVHRIVPEDWLVGIGEAPSLGS
jgi:tetratricopeptide (TPR) repeat protein